MAQSGNAHIAAHAPAALLLCAHGQRIPHQPAQGLNSFLSMHRPEAQRKWLHHCLRTLHKVQRGRCGQLAAGSWGVRYRLRGGQASWESIPARLIQWQGAALDYLSTCYTAFRRCMRTTRRDSLWLNLFACPTLHRPARP